MENESPIQNEGKTITVVVNASSSDTKADLEDGESIYWEAGETLKAVCSTGDASATAVLGADKYHASFTFTLVEGNDYVFRSNGHGNDEFAFSNDMTQAEAGVMNKSYLFLQSGKTYGYTASASNPTLNPGMKIVGTILRFIPFTTNSTYETESVQKVELQAPNNFTGTIGYNYSTGAAKFDGEHFWAGKKSAKVTLGTALSLSGVDSREKSAGIYMPIPVEAGNLNSGYKVIVTTDVAVYTFNSTKAMTLTDNSIQNIALNLNKASLRVKKSNAGVYKYEGSLPNNPTLASSDAVSLGTDLWYWYPAFKPVGEDSYTRYSDYTTSLYTGVTFDWDADWITNIQYRHTGETITDAYIDFAVSENTGVSRSADITITYPSSYVRDGLTYHIEGDVNTKVITLTQPAAPGVIDFKFKKAETGGGATNYLNTGNVIPRAGAEIYIGIDTDTDVDWTATVYLNNVSQYTKTRAQSSNFGDYDFVLNTGAAPTNAYNNDPRREWKIVYVTKDTHVPSELRTQTLIIQQDFYPWAMNMYSGEGDTWNAYDFELDAVEPSYIQWKYTGALPKDRKFNFIYKGDIENITLGGTKDGQEAYQIGGSGAWYTVAKTSTNINLHSYDGKAQELSFQTAGTYTLYLKVNKSSDWWQYSQLYITE